MTLLARLHVLQGRLRQAAATYAQVVQGSLHDRRCCKPSSRSLFYYFGLGDLLREWNDLDAAEQHLVQGMALVKETLTADPPAAILGYITLARLQQARGNIREAFETLDALAQSGRAATLRCSPVDPGGCCTSPRHFCTNRQSSALRYLKAIILRNVRQSATHLRLLER